jgi:hypothetical protein
LPAIGIIDGFSARRIDGVGVLRLVDRPARIDHGDQVTAILTQTLRSGFARSGATLELIDVVEQSSLGPAASADALIAALDRLAAEKVGLINISLAGPAHPGVAERITALSNAGTVIVAAVGNAGPAAPPLFPAAYPAVIGVTATDAAGAVYLFAGRGAHVDVAAPGVGVTTGRGSDPVDGTSFAAPHVTAILAGHGVDRESGPAGAVRLLGRLARDGGARGRDPVYGLGVVRAPAAGPGRTAQN